jgi:hypothetical protein
VPKPLLVLLLFHPLLKPRNQPTNLQSQGTPKIRIQRLVADNEMVL